MGKTINHIHSVPVDPLSGSISMPIFSLRLRNISSWQRAWAVLRVLQRAFKKIKKKETVSI